MIYLDNAATTRPDVGAFDRARDEVFSDYFNPSANYGGGFAVRAKVTAARESLLRRIADPAKFELEFTSGGTEADNHAIACGAKRGNAVTTAGEHSAVYESFVQLRAKGVEPRFAPVRSDGSVDSEALLALVDEKTSLVSVVHVNNETGAVNDVCALAQAVKQKNPRCLFHSDGVQAFGKIPVKLSSAIDLYSVSAHKIGGMKGTGALIRKRGTAIYPLLFGGGQENGMRSGTENVFGILGFAYAADRKFSAMEADGRRLAEYRELLWTLLSGQSEGIVRISPQERCSPYILTFSALGARGEVLARMLFDRGVCVGTGSACSSKKPHSRILEACKYDTKTLDGVLRVSFSPETTREEVEIAAKTICEAVRSYREKV